jgi:lysophospholipase L1-like esterase
MRRVLRWGASGVLVVCLGLATAEATLQVASLFVHDRSGDGWRPGADYRVLCVGDSHTYGAGVAEPDSYPAHLQRFLDERAPGRYSVLNLGVPGMSTRQVLNRLPLNVDRLSPDLVIVWCGINDAWNLSELSDDPGGWAAWLDRVAVRSRLYRLLRVRLHDWRFERDLSAVQAKEGTRYRIASDAPEDPRAPQTVHWGSAVERVQHEVGEFKADAAMEQRVADDLEAMVRYASGAGVRLVFVTYPLDFSVSYTANRAIRRVAKELGVRLVESPPAMQRVPKERYSVLWAGHPSGPTYEEIARDVADAVVTEATTHGQAVENR